MKSNPLFAVTAPGAAPYAANELQQLGLLSPAPAPRKGKTADELAQRGAQTGGVAFEGDLRALYRANLHLRTANRVLLRAGAFRAVGFGELRKLAARLPWERYVAAGQPLALRVTCHKSRLYHSDAVAERIAAAVEDRLGKAPPLQTFDEEADDGSSLSGVPPQLVVVRLLHDICTISIDSSGSLLHRRGYRLATAKAPLRETLAATVLLAAGWMPTAGQAPAALLDPFCGSGTIAIEAALLALGIAPGLAAGGNGRQYAFMNWQDFDAASWQEVVSEAKAQQGRQTERVAQTLTIWAADRDAGAVETAGANAGRAGVAEFIRFARQSVSDLRPPPQVTEPGWVITNPPYGLRIGSGQDVRNLYAQFGKVLHATCPNWHVAVLANDPKLLSQLRMHLDTSLALVNGGIAVRLGRGIVAP